MRRREWLWAISKWAKWPAMVLLALNFENLAARYGLDKLLADFGSPAMDSVLGLLQSGWFQYPAAFVVGGASFFYLDRWMARLDQRSSQQEISNSLVGQIKVHFAPEDDIHVWRINGDDGQTEATIFSVRYENVSDSTICDVATAIEGDWRGLFREPNLSYDHASPRFHEPNIYACNLHPHVTMPVTLFVVDLGVMRRKSQEFSLVITARDMRELRERFRFDPSKRPALKKLS